jgi:hypothetical protein
LFFWDFFEFIRLSRFLKNLLAAFDYLITKLARPMRNMNANVAIIATVVSMAVLLSVLGFKIV